MVSEIWDSREQFETFGERLMPVLKDAGIGFTGEPELLEVHNVIARQDDAIASSNGLVCLWRHGRRR